MIKQHSNMRYELIHSVGLTLDQQKLLFCCTDCDHQVLEN